MKGWRHAKRAPLLLSVTLLISSTLLAPHAQSGLQAERHLVSAPAFQQRPQQPIGRKPPVTQISPNTIKVNKRPPVAFKPFPMVDPKTNKQVSPDYVLALPDGRQVKAGSYYAELNKIEQGLNQLGYSLRTMPDRTVLQESIVDRASLQLKKPPAQAAALALARRPRVAKVQLAQRFGPVETLEGRRVLMAGELTPDAVSATYARAGQPRSTGVVVMPTASIPPPAPPKVYHREQAVGPFTLGKASTFQAYLGGKFVTDIKVYPMSNASNAELYKSNTESSVSATAQAGGYILDHGFELFKANASFYAPANTSKPLNAKMTIAVVGATVYNFNQNFADKWSKSDTLSYGVKVPAVAFGVPLGPVIVGGEFGVKGDAGFRYGVSLHRAGVSGHVDPFIHTSVYGEGGASILVGGAGVGVALTLLNADLQLYGKAQLGWLIKWMIFDEMYADLELNLLSGRVYAFAYVYYPCPKWDDPFDFCKKQWEHDFWDWSGYKQSMVLADHKNIVAFDKW